MRRSTVRSFLILLFLCNGYSVNAQFAALFAYPDSLFGCGNFALAAAEYERIYFVSTDAEIRNEALLKKSYCYKQNKNFEKAANTLKRIDFTKATDTLYKSVSYEYALNTYLNGDYSECMLQLDEMKKKGWDTLNNDYLLLRIIVLNEMKRWEESSNSLKNYITVNSIKPNPSDSVELFKKPRLKNEKFAKDISYLIPGSGQIYAGHWGRGMSSLLLSSAFVAYTYVSFVNGFYISGVFSGFSTFRSFWTGGAKYAEYLAKEKNKERIAKHNNKVKDFILK
jgi:tetratricopeptide (TPR) repeat protein